MEDRPVVLIVDDESAIRSLLSEALEDEGMASVTAANGRDALAILENLEPAVIVLDIMMPVMDGWTFLQEYEQRYPNGCPVVLISANARSVENVNRTKVVGFVPKPFDIFNFSKLVERAVNRSSGR